MFDRAPATGAFFVPTLRVALGAGPMGKGRTFKVSTATAVAVGAGSGNGVARAAAWNAQATQSLVVSFGSCRQEVWFVIAKAALLGLGTVHQTGSGKNQEGDEDGEESDAHFGSS